MPVTHGTPPPLRKVQHRSKNVGLILPIIMTTLGMAVAVVGTIKIVRLTGGESFRFAIPGETVGTISKPGDYRLWLETRAAINGTFQTFPNTLPPESRITVSQLPDEIPIELSMSGNITVTVNGTSRVALSKLTLPQTGEYLVTVSGPQERRYLYLNEASSALDFFKAIGTTILGAVILLGGAIWAIVRATRQRVR